MGLALGYMKALDDLPLVACGLWSWYFSDMETPGQPGSSFFIFMLFGICRFYSFPVTKSCGFVDL